MKIYLAGPCDSEHRTMMTKIAKVFRDNKQEVYCPWELKIENAWDMPQEDWAQKVFEADIKALNNSDIVIMISYGRISSTGTAWEQGYCYAKNIPVHVVQVNTEPTSLMVYCGCDSFIDLNAPDETTFNTLLWLLEQNSFKYHGKCSTVLT